jgi:hypothetical protein
MSRTGRPAWVEAEYERIGGERDAASRETDRLYRWELVRVCAVMFGWMVLGIVIAGFGFRAHDHETGMIYIYAGMVINSAGVLWTIVRAYRRGEERGDW